MNCKGVWSGCTTWSHCNSIAYSNVDPIYIGLTLWVVDLNYHLNELSWHVTILFKKNVGTGKSFVNAATACNLSLGWFFLTFNHSALSESNLSREFHLECRWHWLNRDGHMIDNNSFFSRGYVTEWCGPTFKSLETEWKAVLAGLEPVALINHGFVFRKHVPGLIIGHFIVFVSWISNVLGPVVVIFIIFGLWIWNYNRSLF